MAVSGASVVERVMTDRGELVLRRFDEHFEVISNGTFLMDTRDGRSERLLARAALDRHPAPDTVLIGGLGVGFTLEAALADARLRHVVVVEVESTLVDWHRTHLSDVCPGILADPRVDVVIADLHDVLETSEDRYDVICLDVDNGPDWTVVDRNAAFYDDAGIDRMVQHLTPDGVLAVWSAAPAPGFQRRLEAKLRDVQTLEVPVDRGAPDVVMIGTR